LRNNIETVEALGIQINEVRAVGGGLKSPVWLQTLGKILKKPVSTVNMPDTANLGNILLCGKALGMVSSYQQSVERMVAVEQVVHYPGGVPVYSCGNSIVKRWNKAVVNANQDGFTSFSL
jgi:xylulokinase